MLDADGDGFGENIVLSCCLEIEMMDSNNGDWEGASISLSKDQTSHLWSPKEFYHIVLHP